MKTPLRKKIVLSLTLFGGTETPYNRKTQKIERETYEILNVL